MTTPAVKLTVIVERLLKPAVERLLTEAGVTGWSVFPGGGMGAHGLHRADAAQLVREFAIVKIETVLRDRATAERIAETLTSHHLADQSGIVWLSPVEVWRASKF
ncbi:hypothetical protein KY389_13205 [Paracoccus bogoriensis]|uniref:P-II family nitrogen regulator n=1 Tax=Paracoccus bogoriensis TaxID=242065 RepID=UPI001CA565D5|nr:hypothetical protein [Paracoccus bogoriensis]MBW7057630.1 hypothetical protein [Paracoccus bogoriensis]